MKLSYGDIDFYEISSVSATDRRFPSWFIYKSGINGAFKTALFSGLSSISINSGFANYGDIAISWLD